MPQQPELDFFNTLTGRLEVQLSEPAYSPPDMVNEIAPADAEVLDVEFIGQVFENRSFRNLTSEELNRVALSRAWCSLKGEAGVAVRHRAPNGQFFTVGDLFAAVEETERQTRHLTGWLGGIDVHHVFFEGIRLTRRFPERTWTIDWGS